ncbi:AFR640Wp [Eremothecium gossypii ATCC 10895]|uniref:cysteine--tRNA ligase n=1 Tax=Eremothecium gossypii (strain ATCC 10895 / CBS 109.51 / FGSC 9923 / NRRL Y-1056) TaxID=284811 RepID=Q752D6_EREGS|nr:AFR640Wp [Eremothecium gossypii ATCC 10895]AAS54011.2 AFR640Wp [Eremothecium gossypii ATCC 10895]AEY98325.1 FAFR640Wp [Eremothecium gossypii FDAG1]
MQSVLRLSVIRNMSGSVKVVQPPWQKPVRAAEQPVLKLYNSLTRTKDEFIPLSQGRNVTWYSCGPTVYDASHMGHARNYVSIDINRRLIEDYFGYHVEFVQNVTDIDDKIILRARQEHLYAEYVAAHPSVDQLVLADATEAVVQYFRKHLNPDLTTISAYEQWYAKLDLAREREANAKFAMHTAAVGRALDALENPTVPGFLTAVKDVLVPLLDGRSGASVRDPDVFRALAAHWENSFNADMERLGVRPPSVTTRVSEYVDEIVKFIERIVANGYAYATSDGSVYFDTVQFEAGGHAYPKCQPWNRGVADLIADGEGALATGTEKQNPNDFALWKASKAGEPEWPSPWGLGRPGWHIECSVMASDVLGERVDIHSGGIDLAFPHHDNELAQAEACFNSQQWVNYFLHTGHLHIEGQKMSKSLKNFITIDEALKMYSARQLRLAFAMSPWGSPLDFKEATMVQVRGWESAMGNFFRTVRALANDGDGKTRPGVREAELRAHLADAAARVHENLCDNLSTHSVLRCLGELVGRANAYIGAAGPEARVESVAAVARFCTRILAAMGIPARADGLGWLEQQAGAAEAGEAAILPYVRCLARFRDEVRKGARGGDTARLLAITDRVRDVDLPALGVLLEDRQDRPALVKFATPEELKQRELEAEEKEKAARAAVRAKEAAAAREEERRARARVPPTEMFRGNSAYSAFDADGVPTADAEGEPLSKSMCKKLRKQWEQQKKAYDAWVAVSGEERGM